jgi:hypothetical protein
LLLSLGACQVSKIGAAPLNFRGVAPFQLREGISFGVATDPARDSSLAAEHQNQHALLVKCYVLSVGSVKPEKRRNAEAKEVPDDSLTRSAQILAGFISSRNA